MGVGSSPKNDGLFGRDKLYKLLVDTYKLPVTKVQVMEFLNEQKVHQMNRQVKNTGVVKPLVIKGGPMKYIQVDLMDFQKLSPNNNNVNFLMTAYDLYSKYLWVVLLKKKDDPHMIQSFQDLLDDMKIKPKTIQSDNGIEFKSDAVTNFLKDKGIKQVFSKPYHSESQGGIENKNRLIRSMLRKYFQLHKTKKWIDVIHQMVSAYNNTVHDVTGVTPISVIKKDKKIDEKLLLGAMKKKNYVENKDLQAGNFIRVKNIQKDTVGHKKNSNFSEKVYTITKVITPRNVLNDTYYLLDNQLTKYYYNDLLKVPRLRYPKEPLNEKRYIEPEDLLPVVEIEEI